MNTNIASGFLAELDAEFPITRTFLSRIPDAKLNWKPHEKSMTIGQLGLHIAQVPFGVLSMALQDSGEIPDMSSREEAKSASDILAA